MRKSWIACLIFAIMIIPCMFLLSACGGEKGEASLSGFTVYVHGEKVTAENNTVTITYDPQNISDWKQNIAVYKTFDDGSTEIVSNTSDYTISGITEQNPSANEEGYDITVKYLDYPAVALKLIVNRASVQRPALHENLNLVYDAGISHFGVDYNTIAELDTAYTDSGDTEPQINAGRYSTTYSLTSNYKWSTENNGSYTDPVVLTWEIKKAPVMLPMDHAFGSGNYTGEEQIIQVADSEAKYELVPGQTFINVGSYNVEVRIKQEFANNYEWEDTATNPSATRTITNAFTIYSSFLMVNNERQTAAITYTSNMFVDGNNDPISNPLNITFETSINSVHVTLDNAVTITVEISDNDGIVAYYKRINGIWGLTDAVGDSINALDASYSAYSAKIQIPADVNGNYGAVTGNVFYINVNKIVITDSIPTISNLVYTGSLQQPSIDMDGITQFTVQSNIGGTNVDENCYVGFKAVANYCFDNGDDGYSDTKIINYNITKAPNTITAFTIATVEDGETPMVVCNGISYTNSNFKCCDFGTPIFEWSSDGATYYNYNPNGIAYNESTPTYDNGCYPIAYGSYFMRAIVSDDTNYAGASKIINFTISSINVNKEGRTSEVRLGGDYGMHSASTNKIYYWLSTETSTPKDVKVYIGGAVVDKLHYDITTTNNTTVGTGTLTVTFKGKYSGYLTKTFTIIDSLDGVERGSIIEFCGNTIINSTIVTNKRLTFIIPEDVIIMANTNGNLFQADDDDGVIGVDVDKLTILGSGTINSTITGSGATICAMDAYVEIRPLYVKDENDNNISTGKLKINTYKGTPESQVANFKAVGGSILVQNGTYTSAGINIWANGMDVTVDEVMMRIDILNGENVNVNGDITFTTDKVSMLIDSQYSQIEIKEGQFGVTTDAYLADGAVGVEILAGTLILGPEAELFSDVGANGNDMGNIITGQPGNMKAAIVAGKPEAGLEGDINITIQSGATVRNSPSSATMYGDKLIIWDITYGYGTYEFNIDIDDGATLSSAGEKRNIKQNDILHTSGNFTVYEMGACTGVEIDNLATIGTDEEHGVIENQRLNISIEKLKFATNIISSAETYVNVSYGDVTIENIESNLKSQMITLTGKGSFYGTYQFKIYYLDAEHFSDGLELVPAGSFVTYIGENISLDSALEINKNITLITPNYRTWTFTTNSTATDESLESEKSAIVVNGTVGNAINVTIIGGGIINGRQAYDTNNANVLLDSANIMYVGAYATLNLYNITIRRYYGATSVMNGLYIDGKVVIDEECLIETNGYAIYINIDAEAKVIIAKGNSQPLELTSSTTSAVYNLGTWDIAETSNGETPVTYSNGNSEPSVDGEGLIIGRNSYIITYNANGATGDPGVTSANVTTGEPLISLVNVESMVKTGFTFAGWNVDATATTGYFTCPNLGNEDEYTLYAIWVEVTP